MYIKYDINGVQERTIINKFLELDREHKNTKPFRKFSNTPIGNTRGLIRNYRSSTIK